ncbi:hypothetical protein NPS74_24810, partial [Cutibacterium acnes subsp. acnes]|nr:hypothetical protein [Cutibacterium acnes subsp. acnes]
RRAVRGGADRARRRDPAGRGARGRGRVDRLPVLTPAVGPGAVAPPATTPTRLPRPPPPRRGAAAGRPGLRVASTLDN